MTVLECAVRLGGLLRKTKEGSELLALKSDIDEKYNGNDNFNQYESFVEKESSRYYFYSWDMAYNTFLRVLDDAEIEHRELFLPTAELVSSDESIKEFSKAAVEFGHIFESLVPVIITGEKYDTVIPSTWKYKIRNAISDIQIAVSRTLLSREVAIFHQQNGDVLNKAATQEYLSKREDKRVLPFTDEALKMMEDATDVGYEEKMLYEKMHLIMEAVKKGVFYGFWKMINEVTEEELITYDELVNPSLKEVSFVHKNNYSSFFGRGWLYKVYFNSSWIYFMAHHKSVHFGRDDDNSVVSGVVYPADDKGFFDRI